MVRGGEALDSFGLVFYGMACTGTQLLRPVRLRRLS